MVKMNIESVTPVDSYDEKGSTNMIYFEQFMWLVLSSPDHY